MARASTADRSLKSAVPRTPAATVRSARPPPMASCAAASQRGTCASSTPSAARAVSVACRQRRRRGCSHQGRATCARRSERPVGSRTSVAKVLAWEESARSRAHLVPPVASPGQRESAPRARQSAMPSAIPRASDRIRCQSRAMGRTTTAMARSTTLPPRAAPPHPRAARQASPSTGRSCVPGLPRCASPRLAAGAAKAVSRAAARCLGAVATVEPAQQPHARRGAPPRVFPIPSARRTLLVLVHTASPVRGAASSYRPVGVPRRSTRAVQPALREQEPRTCVAAL